MLPSSDPKFVPALHTIIILRPRRFFTQLLQKPGTKIQSIRLWKLLSVKKNPSSPDQQLLGSQLVVENRDSSLVRSC